MWFPKSSVFVDLWMIFLGFSQPGRLELSEISGLCVILLATINVARGKLQGREPHFESQLLMITHAVAWYYI